MLRSLFRLPSVLSIESSDCFNQYTAQWSCIFFCFSNVTLDTTGERAGLPNSMTVLPFPWVPWCCLKGNKVFVFSHLIKFSDVMFMHILKIWYIYVLNLLHVTLLYLLFTGIWAPEQQNIPTAYMSVWFFDYIICFSAKCFDIFL